MHHFYPRGGSSILWGLMGFVGTLVVLTLITLLIVFLIRRAKEKKYGPAPMGEHPHHRRPMPPALQILDERLARGEIEIEDYVTRKAALLGSTDPGPHEWTPRPADPNPAAGPDAPMPNDGDKPNG